MAFVAKSTMSPGQNNTISRINAPTLTCLAGCPSAGLVRWHSLTGPQKSVAHELNETAINKIAEILINDFFISLFICNCPTRQAFRFRPVF